MAADLLNPDKEPEGMNGVKKKTYHMQLSSFESVHIPQWFTDAVDLYKTDTWRLK